jgi:hypothetical protein
MEDLFEAPIAGDTPHTALVGGIEACRQARPEGDRDICAVRSDWVQACRARPAHLSGFAARRQARGATGVERGRTGGHVGEGDRSAPCSTVGSGPLPLAYQSCNVASMVSQRAARAFAGLLPAAIAPETADKRKEAGLARAYRGC